MMKEDVVKGWSSCLVPFALGIVIGACCLRLPGVSSFANPALVVELHRFKVKPEQLPEFDRWIAFEHAHHKETVATLEREHMYVESIFRDAEHDPTTIYWVEVRGADGAPVANSPLPIDKVYEGFMKRTLVPGSHGLLKPEYTLVPPFLMASIRAHAEADQGRKQ